MRKYLILLLAVMVTLISGCENNKIEDEVENFIQQQQKYVNERNFNKYVETISRRNSEYLAEKSSWMRDILRNNIEKYTLEIKDIKVIDDHHVSMDIKQSYFYNGKEYHVTMPLGLTKEDGNWRDSDLMFEEIQTKHFKIKYFKSSEKYGRYVANVCEDALENVINRYGRTSDDIITIKIYEDMEMLRQSVKLSFGWQFAGWYEYPESIKTITFDHEETYLRILEHELTHKFTIEDANNNLPYWFTEGLAVYFSNFNNEPKEYSTKKYYLDRYGDMVMNIEKLEKVNLEKMEDDREISNYYDSSGMIVKFMVETYGLPTVKEIIKELGKFPYQKGTGSEVDMDAIERFHRVLDKVIDTNVKDLDRQWEGYLYQS